MKYCSTRNSGVEVLASQAIVNGLSSDGGLFVPVEIPSVSAEFINSLSNKTYNERAVEILKLFLTEFTEEEIKNCVNSAYTNEKFEGDNPAPISKVGENEYFLELWHGPTCAFKDMALQLLPHLLTTSIKKTGEDKTVVILVATSGDTGKAALEGFCDVEGTKIIVFYPKDGVSDIQKLQMVTQEGKNVFVGAVKGNFDDAQNGVKKIFTDTQYKNELEVKKYMLSSANSINWGRLVPQIIYYFSAYADLISNGEIQNGDKINIDVPTGNFGNILAAYYSKKMGLPVNKLICASNENNVLTDFINTGIYDKNRDFKLTISPSMDILISSNLERLLYDLSGCNSELISDYMNKLSTEGKYEVSDEIKAKIKETFCAGYADDSKTKSVIKKTQETYGYIMDTHTAVAKCVYDEYKAKTGDNTKTIIASTASPFKFNSSVLSALIGDHKIKGIKEYDLLNVLKETCNLKIPSSLAELNKKEIRFDKVINKEEMKALISEFLK